jgi:hypothetical protein
LPNLAIAAEDRVAAGLRANAKVRVKMSAITHAKCALGSPPVAASHQLFKDRRHIAESG